MGHLVGKVMAYENRERNTWAVSLLDIQPTDSILEIGFGPGLAIHQIAQAATNGFVGGIDQSSVMLKQATKRNQAGIEAGRVELKQASVMRIPYPDNTFDKVLTVNTLHHWPDRQEGLQEVQRVLKPDGIFFLIEQPRSAATQAMLTELSTHLMAQLDENGFQAVRYVAKAMKPVATVAAIGIAA